MDDYVFDPNKIEPSKSGLFLPTQTDTDPVNHPEHYQMKNGLETIDFIRATVDDFESYCVGNILKYVCRYQNKNGLEDLKKAAWYLTKLIEEKEEA